jgi:hypothetical protein
MKNFEIDEGESLIEVVEKKETWLSKLKNKFKQTKPIVEAKPTIIEKTTKEESIWDDAMLYEPMELPKGITVMIILNMFSGIIALGCGIAGALIIFEQLPLNGTLVVGIIAVAASTGLIINLSRG